MACSPKANPEDRNFAGQLLNDRNANTCILWNPRPRAEQHAIEVCRLGRRHCIVAPHCALGAELREILDEVVNERVVVVDNQDARAHNPRVRGDGKPGLADSSTVTSVKGNRAVAAVGLFSVLLRKRGAAYDPRFSDDRIGIFVPAGAERSGALEQLLRSAGAVEVRHEGA